MAGRKRKRRKEYRVPKIVEEFEQYQTKLANWQRFCNDIGIEGTPCSITKCKKALARIWINIYDFIDAHRKGESPRRFPSQRALADYTIEEEKIYPKRLAKEGGPVRALLAHIFRD